MQEPSSSGEGCLTRRLAAARILPVVEATSGWILLVAGGAVLALTLTVSRRRLSRPMLDVTLAFGGVIVATGGLLLVGDAGPGSWLVASLVLGAGAVAQERALFAPGGPFRT
jgi:hypothetical protein